jgi:hypothetical protein
MEIKKHFRERCVACGAESAWQVDNNANAIYCTPCLEKETGLKVRRAVMVTATAIYKGHAATPILSATLTRAAWRLWVG